MNRVKIVVTIPPSHLEAVQTAVFEAGAGVIGNYSCCSTVVKSIGTFKPENDAEPYIGTVGNYETVEEIKLEFVCDITIVKEVLAAMRNAHPYEEPAIDLIPLLGGPPK
ncbi:hypothetical protein IJ103_03050 [Candidatus Saccharibacteria bacterium]|nr:hypothetical protein [Candidatus Saccharibacteria bacterium]